MFKPFGSWRDFCLLLMFLSFAVAGRAQSDPLLGKNQYPQYRNLSGLAGGGYGLDSQGYGSLSGPTAFSTPIAYVLGHDRIRLGIGALSFNGDPAFGGHRANGTGIITYGHSFGSVNIAFTDFIKSSKFDQAYNLQAGLVPFHDKPLAFSVGVQDVVGNGGSAGEKELTDRFSSQSVFLAATYRLVTTSAPVYFSAGIGTHRFGKAFASTSYRVARPLRLWLEYDGWGFNEGVLLAFRSGRRRTALETNATVGWVRGRYFALSLVFGF